MTSDRERVRLDNLKREKILLHQRMQQHVTAARYYRSEHNRAMAILAKASATKRKAEKIHGKSAFAQALEQANYESVEPDSLLPTLETFF